MADLVIPFESIGTTISDLFWWGLPSLVFANRHAQSACKAKDGRQGSSFKMSSCFDLQPIGDPHLGAVDHQVAAVPPGRSGQRSHIASSSGLTHLYNQIKPLDFFLDDKHRNAGDHISGQGRHKEVPFQLFASKVCQGWGGAVSLNLEKVCQVSDISSVAHSPLLPWQFLHCRCGQGPQEKHSCICSSSPGPHTPHP